MKIQQNLQVITYRITTQLNMIDETTKFNRAKGYYNRIALAGNTDGAFKELVAFNKQADERIPFSEG